MSNEMTLFLQQNAAMLAAGAGGPLDEDTLAVAGSGGGKRISIKAGVFRKIVGGKEVATLEERHMNIIFVKMAHNPSRTLYTNAYTEGDKTPPVCWSSDAKTPDPECKTPQGKTCDTCPMSVKGSGRNGEGSACRIGWRTAVVLPGDVRGDVLQLVIPAASAFGQEENGRWPFRPYIQMLAGHNISAGRVVTRMSFDIAASSPRVLFNPVAAVAPEELTAISEQAQTRDAEQAVKLTVFVRDQQAAAEPAPAAHPTSVPAPAAVAPTAAVPPPAAPATMAAPAMTAAAPAPVVPATVAVAGVEAAIPEPTLRQTAAPAAAAVSPDVASVINKWSTKK